MDMNEIDHLDEISPFDAIVSLDQTLTIYRKALAAQLASTLTYDAVRDSLESDLLHAGTMLYAARESLVAAVEEAE